MASKNFMPFVGHLSLTDWAAAQAMKLDIPVYVSTDMAEWHPQDTSVHVIRRPEVLSGDLVGTWDVVEHACYTTGNFGAVILLQPTSPLRTVEDIRRCVELSNMGQRNVTSVHKGQPNGAVYVRAWKMWGEVGVQYNMPWVRSCDIDLSGDFEAAQNLLSKEYVEGLCRKPESSQD